MGKHSKNKRKLSVFYITVVAVMLAAAGITRLAINSAVTTADITESSTSSYTSVYSYTAKTSSQKAESIYKDTTNTESVTSKTTASKKATAKTESTAKKKRAGASVVVYSMPIKGTIQKDFATDNLIYSKTYGDMRAHNGIDIVAEEGTVVKSAADGKVTKIYDDTLWGKTVIIDHGGSVKTHYSGMKDVSLKVGETVKMGKVIGTVGTVPSEILDKPHLHFSATKDGKAISPLDLIN